MGRQHPIFLTGFSMALYKPGFKDLFHSKEKLCTLFLDQVHTQTHVLPRIVKVHSFQGSFVHPLSPDIHGSHANVKAAERFKDNEDASPPFFFLESAF